jgi:hypothetical protein
VASSSAEIHHPGTFRGRNGGRVASESTPKRKRRLSDDCAHRPLVPPRSWQPMDSSASAQKVGENPRRRSYAVTLQRVSSFSLHFAFESLIMRGCNNNGWCSNYSGAFSLSLAAVASGRKAGLMSTSTIYAVSPSHFSFTLYFFLIFIPFKQHRSLQLLSLPPRVPSNNLHTLVSPNVSISSDQSLMVLHKMLLTFVTSGVSSTLKVRSWIPSHLLSQFRTTFDIHSSSQPSQ